jgi:trimeric autotransporter adhesin
MKTLLVFLLVALAGLLPGCGGGSGSSSTPTLISIAVTPADSTVPVGTFTQFKATGTYSPNNTTQDLTATATWISSNTAVATIASGGLATALSTTSMPIKITATSGTVSGNTGLTVATATLTSIVVCANSSCTAESGEPTITIAKGTSFQFTALGFYNDGSKHDITEQVTWVSLQAGVATITAVGDAQGVGVGSAMITATLGATSGMATLNVTGATLTSIVVGPSDYTIAPLTAQPFTAIGIFSDSTTQNITHDVMWASSTAAATISNTAGSLGVATGVSPGGATTISAKLAGVTGTATLNVSSATVLSIAVTSPSAGMAVGSTMALAAVATLSDNSTQHVETVATWMSSTGVATVNQNQVMGVANGTAMITCVLGGVTSTPANLTVEALNAIAISPASGTVAEGTSIGLKATGTLADMTTQDLTNSVEWTSSNSAFATMSNASGSFGFATGIAPGTVTVTAVFSGIIGTTPLMVTNATLSSIAIKPPNPTITLGAKQQFTATGTFSDGTTELLSGQVIWSSSDLTVAIINATGSVLTTGSGTTTIGAALGTVSDTTGLTVQ